MLAERVLPHARENCKSRIQTSYSYIVLHVVLATCFLVKVQNMYISLPKLKQILAKVNKTVTKLTSEGSIIAVPWGYFRQSVDEMDRPPAPAPTTRN